MPVAISDFSLNDMLACCSFCPLRSLPSVLFLVGIQSNRW
uniref:Uncharacterized protein n=1 Tax=Arundo donax TaxID=35708 RepID=A0A0A9EVQ2_ARUDO